MGDVDAAGVLDGLAGVAEQVADGDLVEEDLAGAEDGAVQGAVAAELGGGAFRLGNQLAAWRSPCFAAV
ncbi:hypothetical protein [Actinacidiphila oryziradicis]|uniref:hypothetical protein n=1 Tax=Actinacidiphila oryziradicis TaxID=2571141 RepID=UPI0023F2369E|nr:hypothetical protein [Actinacidiphila oryziradicis]MCW2874998.1 hypothetical protein [Actinacidiphila oryziradicis]